MEDNLSKGRHQTVSSTKKGYRYRNDEEDDDDDDEKEYELVEVIYNFKTKECFGIEEEKESKKKNPLNSVTSILDNNLLNPFNAINSKLGNEFGIANFLGSIQIGVGGLIDINKDINYLD